MRKALLVLALAVSPLIRADDCLSDTKQTVDVIHIKFNACPFDSPPVLIRVFDGKGRRAKAVRRTPDAVGVLIWKDPVEHYFSPRSLRLSIDGVAGCVPGTIGVDENNQCIAKYDLPCAEHEFRLRVAPTAVPFKLTRLVQPVGVGDTCVDPLPLSDAGVRLNEHDVLDITFFGNDQKTALFTVRKELTTIAAATDAFDKQRQLQLIDEAFKRQQPRAPSRNAEALNALKKARVSDLITLDIERVK